MTSNDPWAPADPFAGSAFLREVAEVEQRRVMAGSGALDARNSAAAQQWADGQLDTALGTFEQVVIAARERLGPHHPDTLVVEGNLAVAYLALNRADVGMPLLAANLAAREETFGAVHVATIVARDAMATALRQAGRLPQAVTLGAQVMAERSRLLGPAHPDTLVSCRGLALTREALGDGDEALALLQAAVDSAEQAFGARHSLTVDLRADLAHCQFRLGRPEAGATRDRVLADAAATFGPDHPDTQELRSEFAFSSASVPEQAGEREPAASPFASEPGRDRSAPPMRLSGPGTPPVPAL